MAATLVCRLLSKLCIEDNPGHGLALYLRWGFDERRSLQQTCINGDTPDKILETIKFLKGDAV